MKNLVYKVLNVAALMLLLCSCSSEEEIEPDPYEGRHADFFPREDFHIGEEFNYEGVNALGYEDIKRSTKELHNHKPEIKVLEEGAKIEITFPSHPHEPKHFWAWIEVIDKSGTEYYDELDEPAEKAEEFKIVVVPEKAFKDRIRIRAFCFVHGEFLDYYDLPDFEDTSIIDR